MSGKDKDLEDIDQELAKPLSTIVQQEANVALSADEIKPDPILIADGWQRRFVADGTRLKEMADLYSEMGLDVRVEPVRQDQMADKCDDCQVHMIMHFSTIYTRKKQS